MCDWRVLSLEGVEDGDFLACLTIVSPKVIRSFSFTAVNNNFIANWDFHPDKCKGKTNNEKFVLPKCLRSLLKRVLPPRYQILSR